MSGSPDCAPTLPIRGISSRVSLAWRGFVDTGMGDNEDPLRRSKLSHTSSHQFLLGRQFRQGNQVDALAIAMGTSHAAYKSRSLTRPPGHYTDAGSSPPAAQHASGDAWLIPCRRTLQNHSTPWRQDEPTWGLPVLRDPARHQDLGVSRSTFRHRQPHGNDGPDSKVLRRQSGGHSNHGTYLKLAMEAMANALQTAARHSTPRVQASKITKVRTTAEMASVYVKAS